MDISKYTNLYSGLYVTVIIVTSVFISSILFINKISYSEEKWTDIDLISYSTSKDGDNIFSVPSIGFRILLPEDWNTIDNENILMISPHEIYKNTGDIKFGQDKLLMIVQIVDLSDFQRDMKEYEESYQRNGCSIVSNKVVEINGIESKEILKQCESPDNERILNYIFATEKSIIFVGLKGTGLGFDVNMDKFMDSVKSIQIKNPSDIEELTRSSSTP